MGWLLLYTGICVLLMERCNAQPACSEINPCPFTGGESYVKTEYVSSTDGKLEFTMQVEIGSITYEWLTLKRRTYNGSIPGPTWRLHAGDQVNMKLVNTLTATSMSLGPMNTLRNPNHTNVHTHGLHISSKKPGDNVFINVGPGESHTYPYQLNPEQPAGTYWYHAHFHGSVMFQVQGGLSGMIIIEDPTTGPYSMPQHLADISCPDNCQHEVPLFFQPTLLFDNSESNFEDLQVGINDSEAFRTYEHTLTNDNVTLLKWLRNSSNGVNYFTVNGVLLPVLTFNTGQHKRFRLVNAAGLQFLEVEITEENSSTPTDACEVWEIALDGVYLDEARKPRLNKTFIAPAGRVDWIVACSRPGVYKLRSNPDAADNCSIGRPENGRYKGILLTLNITGDPVTLPPQNRTLPRRPSFLRDFRNEPAENISNRKFTVELNSEQNLNRGSFAGEGYYRFKLEVNKVNEWHLTNTDPTSGHPLHIHVNSFQIISYNNYEGPVSKGSGNQINTYYGLNGTICGFQSAAFVPGSQPSSIDPIQFVTDPLTDHCPPWHVVNHTEEAVRGGPGTIGYGVPGEFRDVLVVPPLANITIRFMSHEYVGEVVIHCHILYHEDFGMMMTVDIVNEGESLVANETSGGALPGQCFGTPTITATGGSTRVLGDFSLPFLVFLLASALANMEW